MLKKVITVSWIITGVVAFFLLAWTISVAVQAVAGNNNNPQNVSAYLTSNHPMVILLQEPDPRGIVATILTSGTPITATETSQRSGLTWFKVESDKNISGWVQAEFITLEQP
ncbi:MAG: SH3 domain-containing protein [Chloroflexi bacterium]|nr:SH3 domain-containing protein [Chloroflexota bacterium]